MVAVMPATTYRATVDRDGNYWLIRVEGVGVTQARHLREVDVLPPDLVTVMTGQERDSFTVEVTTRLPEEVQGHLTRADELRQTSARTQAEAAAEMRLAARELVAAGLPLRDVGRLLGISHQRAHQLAS